MAYDPETSEWWVSTILWANVLFSYALFVLIAVGHRLDAVLLSNSMLLLIVVGFIGLYLLFHWLIFRLMGYIFRLNMAAESYSKAYFTVISGLGIVLFPIATCLIYLPQHSENYLLMIGYIFIALAIVLLLIKSIQIFYSKIASLFYIILYFCTLEILPILITIKVIFLLL